MNGHAGRSCRGISKSLLRWPAAARSYPAAVQVRLYHVSQADTAQHDRQLDRAVCCVLCAVLLCLHVPRASRRSGESVSSTAAGESVSSTAAGESVSSTAAGSGTRRLRHPHPRFLGTRTAAPVLEQCRLACSWGYICCFLCRRRYTRKRHWNHWARTSQKVPNGSTKRARSRGQARPMLPRGTIAGRKAWSCAPTPPIVPWAPGAHLLEAARQVTAGRLSLTGPTNGSRLARGVETV
jgi:hypothetical protein